MKALQIRILAIDDDEAIRAFFVEFLGKDGHQVVVAENGREALDRLSPPPDVVLLDLGMPVMDGAAFLDELAKLPQHDQLPVVIMTSGPHHGPLVSGSRPIALLPKPFDFDALRQVVQAVARPSRQH